MDRPVLVVVRLSDSFGDLWSELADDLGVELRIVEGREPPTPGPDVAAVLLAAGGAEREAVEWLEGHEKRGTVPFLAVGSDPGRRIAALLVGHGASDYFALPEDVEVLRNALAAAARRRREILSRAFGNAAVARPEAFEGIVGESPALKQVLARAVRLLPHVDATALIVGETGTGKELLARAIHQGGPRHAAPFVTVNCSALPKHLIESELFGHERGAFTDAHATKPGLFEVADGGTLFLDEIGTLPSDLQAKLLRVLEDKEVRRVGGTKSRTVDLRIIAATNENLEETVTRGSFRQDLYFRISVVTLTLPPLRERGEDVLLIAEALVDRLSRQHELPVPSLGPEIRRQLLAYRWPGNVRELKNAVERALLLSEPGELDVSELVPRSQQPVTGSGPLPFPAPLDVITSRAATAMLETCGGNRSEAARRLGISRRRLRRLLDLEQLPT
ncbi:MAG: sigma 54-interacting transcriptional regulator [Gemmatimonadales bacterium]